MKRIPQRQPPTMPPTPSRSRLKSTGARSELSIDMVGDQFDLKDHPLPLQSDHPRGWGRVSIPADLNPADNDCYFAYDVPSPRHTLIVADDAQAVRPLQVAVEVSTDEATESKAEVVTPGNLTDVQWENVGLLLWQSQLPQGDSADLVRSFIDRGGQAIFFPPANPDETQFIGLQWQAWESPEEEISVESWRGDQDLLTATGSGGALPVGDLHVRRFCRLNGPITPLATLHGGAPFLARATIDHGGLYFCTSTVAPADSSLATDGVVLFVALQRRSPPRSSPRQNPSSCRRRIIYRSRSPLATHLQRRWRPIDRVSIPRRRLLFRRPNLCCQSRHQRRQC